MPPPPPGPPSLTPTSHFDMLPLCSLIKRQLLIRTTKAVFFLPPILLKGEKKK